MTSHAGIRIVRADDRFVTAAEGRTTRHSFSFGSHYDADNLGFGAMIAHNDETLPSGTGYADHPHRDTEIVTWVLEGALKHADDTGNTGTLLAGDVQRISAGAGIVHSERTEPGVRTRFLQTWLRPDSTGGAPSYAVERAAPSGDLIEVVGRSGLSVATAGARLYLVHAATEPLVLPDAPLLHLFVVSGRASLGDRLLSDGDAARLRERGGRSLTVEEPLTAAVWAFDV